MEEFKNDSIEVDMEFETTRNIPIPSRLVDQVIGQESGVDIIKNYDIQIFILISMISHIAYLQMRKLKMMNCIMLPLSAAEILLRFILMDLIRIL